MHLGVHLMLAGMGGKESVAQTIVFLAEEVHLVAS